MEALNKKWKPHPFQTKVLRAIFNQGKKRIFIRAGRRSGKTELLLYIPNRICSLFPNTTCSYITPNLKQGKKIIWNDGRLQNFCPQDFGVQISQVETTVKFPNQSFIELDGSENYEAHRGTGKDLLILDEFKDIDRRFYDATYPALASEDGILVIIGTPPKSKDSFYYELEQDIINDPDWAFFKWTTWDNPHIPREWLIKEKDKYYKRGEGDIWQREFEAEYAFGGKDCIFPTWDRDRHTKDSFYLKEEVKNRINEFKLIVACDPATTSTFGVLFCAYSQQSGQFFVLDEIYEQDRAKMTSHAIWYKVLEKKNKIAPNRPWLHVYDEAGAWFANEIMANFNQGLIPTQKGKLDKEKGLSVARELMTRENTFFVAKECKNFIYEVENYFTDENGNIPKKKDHLIDDLRYCFQLAGVRFTYDHANQQVSNRRAYTMEDDMLEKKRGKDFYDFLDDELLC